MGWKPSWNIFEPFRSFPFRWGCRKPLMKGDPLINFLFNKTNSKVFTIFYLLLHPRKDKRPENGSGESEEREILSNLLVEHEILWYREIFYLLMLLFSLHRWDLSDTCSSFSLDFSLMQHVSHILLIDSSAFHYVAALSSCLRGDRKFHL